MIITCRDVTEAASDYLEHKLHALDQAGFKLHLVRCSHCRAYLAQLQATIAAARALPLEGPDAELEEKLKARFASLTPKE
jgi:predicted anti-sigma-YlaC factor YlaD